MIKRIVLLIIFVGLLVPSGQADSQAPEYINNVTLEAYIAYWDGKKCVIDDAYLAEDIEIRLEYWFDDVDDERQSITSYGRLGTMVEGELGFAYGMNFPQGQYRACPNLIRDRWIQDLEGSASHRYIHYYYQVPSVSTVFLPLVGHELGYEPVRIPRPSTPTP